MENGTSYLASLIVGNEKLLKRIEDASKDDEVTTLWARYDDSGNVSIDRLPVGTIPVKSCINLGSSCINRKSLYNILLKYR